MLIFRCDFSDISMDIREEEKSLTWRRARLGSTEFRKRMEAFRRQEEEERIMERQHMKSVGELSINYKYVRLLMFSETEMNL